MIHCDDVFEILTRGPFPNGESSDELVERHLGSCAGCRRLAEALRPAIELFEEAIGPEESRHLPRYWGEAATDVIDVCETAVAPPHAGVFRREKWEKRLEAGRNVGRFIAAIAVGIVIAAVFDRSRSHPVEAPADDGASQDAASDMATQFADWRPSLLPAACRVRRQVALANPHEPTLAAAIASELEQSCCTDCHHAARIQGAVQQDAPGALSAVILACKTCHLESLQSVP